MASGREKKKSEETIERFLKFSAAFSFHTLFKVGLKLQVVDNKSTNNGQVSKK